MVLTGVLVGSLLAVNTPASPAPAVTAVTASPASSDPSGEVAADAAAPPADVPPEAAAPATPAPAVEEPPAPPGPSRHSRAVGGVTADLVVVAPAAVDTAALATAVFDEIARVEAVFAVDAPELAALMAEAGGPARSVEPEVFAVLVEAARVAKLSKGAFDPTVASLDELYTEAATSDGDRRVLPAPAVVKARRAVVGVDQLVLDPVRRTARLKTKGARLDISAAARGYGLDRARGLLIERGATGFVLAMGGDVVVHGTKDGGAPWIVGVQDPRSTGPFMTVASSTALGGAVMTAVDTDGAFVVDGIRQHRLLDPRTGEPARQSRSVAVFGGDALTAKCLARAIFVLGPKAGLALAARHKGVEVVIVDDKNAVHLSPGLKKLGGTDALHQRPPTDAP